MANPQCENGYTKIANELLEALCHIRINGEARQVLDVIIRKTYGFNKKQDSISLSQFSLMTGLKRPTICKAIAKLKKMNLIIITQKDNSKATIFRFNKDFDSWEALPKKITLPKKIMRLTQKDNASLPKKIHTKDNTTKDNNTKEILRSDAVAENLNPLIFLFKEINPSYKTLYADKTQRACLSRIIKERGREEVERVIKILPQTNKMQFAPIITTPFVLEKKYGDLMAFCQRQKLAKPKVGVVQK